MEYRKNNDANELKACVVAFVKGHYYTSFEAAGAIQLSSFSVSIRGRLPKPKFLSFCYGSMARMAKTSISSGLPTKTGTAGAEVAIYSNTVESLDVKPVFDACMNKASLRFSHKSTVSQRLVRKVICVFTLFEKPVFFLMHRLTLLRKVRNPYIHALHRLAYVQFDFLFSLHNKSP